MLFTFAFLSRAMLAVVADSVLSSIATREISLCFESLKKEMNI